MKPYYSDDLVTLYHGDCRELPAWLEADVLVSDPPYGTGGQWGYGRRLVHNPLGRTGMFIASDSDTAARDWLLGAWGDRPALVFASARLPEPPGEWGHRLVWDKVEPGMNGGPWRYTHELIFVRGKGWTRTSATSYSVLRFPRSDGMTNNERQEHPHRKPVGLMGALIASAPEGTIADPFSGTGSTLRAAKNLGRHAVGVELDERYCEIAARRLSQEVIDFGGAA